jgi:hypothetical protein
MMEDGRWMMDDGWEEWTTDGKNGRRTGKMDDGWEEWTTDGKNGRRMVKMSDGESEK